MGDSEDHLPAKNDQSLASQVDGEEPWKKENPETRNGTCDPADLLMKGDKVVDLERGRQMSVEGSIGDASLWVSAKRLLNTVFIQLDFWSLAEAKPVEPTFCLKAPMDPHKTGVEVLPHKAENKNEGKNPRIESENLNLKPSGKKPPRPPKPPRLPNVCGDSSKDRVIKATLRRAKLEKLAFLKKKQMHKSKTSGSSLWALVCTLCFCVVMVIQGTGLFSQGNTSGQITPAVPAQTETFNLHKYDNHAANSESLHAIMQDQLSSSFHRFGPALDKAGQVQSDLKS